MPARLPHLPSSTRGPRRPLGLVVLAVLGLGVGVAEARAQGGDGLARGEISVSTQAVEGSDVREIVVRAVIDAPPEKVWEVVTDCDRFEQRMPNIESATEIKREGNRSWCDVEVDLPFPLSNLRAVSVATHSEQTGVWKRSWTLVRGDYEFNDGSWVLTPFENDWNRTLAVYRVHVKPNIAVPGWVRERAQKTSMPDLIRRVGEEAGKLK